MVNYTILTNISDYENNSIGYLNTSWNIFMIFLSCFGIIINLYFGITYLKRIIQLNKDTKQNAINVSLIEKILCIISIVETFISVGWLINSLFMSNTFLQEQQNISQCRILGLLETFFYLFDWMILSYSLYQIKQMVMNPLRLLRPDLLLAKHIAICFSISLLFSIFCFFLGIVGKSPMITCFIDISQIKNTNNKLIKNIMFWIFFTSPIILFGFGFYEVIIMAKSNNFKNDKKNEIFFVRYIVYILIYIILAFMLISLYLINYIYGEIIPSMSMKLYIQIITILSCSTPLFVGIIRLFKTDLIQKLKCEKKDDTNDLDENLIDNKKIGNFNEFEQDLLRTIIIKYYIGLSFALGKANYFETEEEENNEDSNYINTNDINTQNNLDSSDNINKKNEINENKEEINEDDKVNNDNNNKDDQNDPDVLNINKEEKIDNLKISINSINSINNNDSPDAQNINILQKDGKNLANETTEYHITNSEILKDLDLTLNDDIVVLNQSKINIKITEYCTQLFKKIREIEGITEDEIINVIQPKNSNNNLIQTFSKNLFYINSTNKEYLIKQISLDEINFYRNSIINNIYQYFKINKNSLILRIQGLYDIQINDSDKNKKQYIALMHNIYESLGNKEEDSNMSFSFQKNNVSRKNVKKGIKIYKIKKSEFDSCIVTDSKEENLQNKTVDIGNVKENNSCRIYLDNNEFQRLKNIKKKDVKFLKKIGVLNYYYFVVERPMNKKDIENIFKDTGNSKKKKEFDNIKKYLFKSNKKNIVYSISIVDYYKDPIKL